MSDLLLPSGAAEIDPALARAVEEALAKADLMTFAQRCVHGFVPARHLHLLCDVLERVERGEVDRVIISAPPGHGKSTILQAFVAWYLGRQPGRRAMLISASEALARRNSRAVRDIVSSDEYPWEKTSGELVTDALGEWMCRNGSGVKSIGVGGVITGFRMHLEVLDDVQSERGSPATRTTLEEWWREQAVTRLEPSGVVVAIATRWSTDDFISRLLEGDDGARWVHINLAAVSEGARDPLGRPEGEALWPERWPLQALETKRAEVGSAAYESQYQGRPVPEGGAMVKEQWLGEYEGGVPTHMVMTREELLEFSSWNMISPRANPKPAVTGMAVDAASKTGVHNDYSAICVGTTENVNLYVQDVVQERLEFTDLLKRVLEVYEQYRPSYLLIEDTSNGTPLIQALRQFSHLPIIPVQAKRTKIERLELILPTIEAGRILLPKNAAWKKKFVEELTGFPGARHDDMVDAFTMLTSWIWSLVERDARFERQKQNVRDFFSR